MIFALIIHIKLYYSHRMFGKWAGASQEEIHEQSWDEYIFPRFPYFILIITSVCVLFRSNMGTTNVYERGTLEGNEMYLRGSEEGDLECKRAKAIPLLREYCRSNYGKP